MLGLHDTSNIDLTQTEHTPNNIYRLKIFAFTDFNGFYRGKTCKRKIIFVSLHPVRKTPTMKPNKNMKRAYRQPLIINHII